jgi:hypothetical protein
MKKQKEKMELKKLALSMKITSLNKANLSKIFGGADVDPIPTDCPINPYKDGCPIPASKDCITSFNCPTLATSCPQSGCISGCSNTQCITNPHSAC